MAKKKMKPARAAPKAKARKKAVPKPKISQIDREIEKLRGEKSFDKMLRDLKRIHAKKLSPHQVRELKWILSHQFVSLVRENVRKGKPIPEELVQEVNSLKLKLWRF